MGLHKGRWKGNIFVEKFPTMNKSDFLKALSRRKFLRNSVVAATGMAIAPSLLSGCSDDDVEAFSPAGTAGEDFGFLEGVASFDPSQNQVVLWSRYTPDVNESGNPTIILDVATDGDFSSVVASESVQVDPDSDNTIIVDVASLEAGTKYYYRFRNDVTGVSSLVGETKTLPTTSNEVKMAVLSCANFQAGQFNVYGAVASSDVDIVVHLGDYIYEYASGGYGTGANGTSLPNRSHDPEGEIFSLNDYRARYRQYRSDAQLQEAHRLKPFICVWDDHEIANDAYKDGAENHNDGEGSFDQRKADALQVWHEYLPARVTNNSEIYRSFNIGGLVNLMMLDTRIIGRDKQLDYAAYPELIASGDATNFLTDWLSESRTLLGSQQKTWLTSELSSSSATWQVLGSQVLMAKYWIPAELLGTTAAIQAGDPNATALFATQVEELLTIKARIEMNDPTLTAEEIARLTTTLPYNLDAWDGYPVERDTILATAVASGKKLVSLAGDTHNAWHADHNLLDLTTGAKTPAGSEFATASVSSPGFEGIFGAELATELGMANVALIDDLKYTNTTQRGYLKMTFTSGEAKGQWYYIDDLQNINTTASLGYETSVS